MKRDDILSCLGFCVPQIKRKRVIIHSDVTDPAIIILTS
jgi:hypothetical protein